ncbi:transposase [Candidatus Wolfebacteria bacterium]|nr:transposase [Candidatus Wolfebacteria bacterium]
MSTTRRKYTAAFKLEAVHLVTDQGQTIAEVSKQLGINPGLLHQWRAAIKMNGELAFTAKAPEKLESEEVRKLRRDLKVAREERDILKKALGFFAKLKH